jgi:hypothetical protein
MTDRPKFWSALFKKQPIERSHDPIDLELEAVRRGFDDANNDFRAAIDAMLADLEARQKRRGSDERF